MEPSEMKLVSELSKSIVAKCGGLPKVIAAVAEDYNRMSYQQTYLLKLKDINENFMHILEGFQSLRGLFSWTQSYLETCKDDLKPCIFYLPVFPIGHDIRLTRLQMRWIAEGYIRDISSETLQTDKERLLLELWEYSMFQFQESSKPAKCQVNGFLHEYVNSRPMEDNLVFVLDGPCRLQPQRAGGQHLTIRKKWDRDMNAFESTDFSRLRSLTVFGECRPFMFDPEKIKMKYVRVLDLEDASGVKNDDLEHIVEVFPRLKFLSLRGCTEITRLPMSLGRLRQLQTLDVRHTSIATLPKAILKLQKLHYVRAGTIHSAPWDEDGQSETQEEIISSSVPVEDTTFAAAPLAPAEDASTPSATASDSEDTTIIETPPLCPAEIATTVAAALLAQTEDGKTVATAPLSPEEDATTGTPDLSALEDDPRIVGADPTTPGEDSSMAAAAPWSRTHGLVTSWLSKMGYRSQSRLDYTNHGVEVPAGIGKLTTLQTFGVANVGPRNKAVILKELHKLTQLCRLSVCGINLDNIHEFFSAIAGLNHLQRLSVRLDKNKDGLFPSLDGTIARPPMTLEGCLKLQGHVRILRSSWIKEFANVDKFDLEVTLQEQDDMQVILDHLIHRTNRSMRRLCIKPIQDGELHIGITDEHEFVGLDLDVLEIVCTTNLQATIGNIGDVDVLRVECSSGSSLQLSGLQAIESLREVWLKGSCSDALKQDLQRQLDQHEDKPVLKVLQPRSS